MVASGTRALLTAVLLSAGLAAGATLGAAVQDGTPNASLLFTDQESNGRILLVDAVRTTHGGFVVVHDASYLDGERFTSILGSSGALGAGAHDHVPVTLDRALDATQLVVAVVHQDSNNNQVFDQPRQLGADPAYTVDGTPVGAAATITVTGAAVDGALPMWPFLGVAAIAFAAIGVGVGSGRLNRRS